MAVIKELAKHFKSYGSFYEQVERKGDIAMYSLRYDTQGPTIGFDVVRVCRTTLKDRDRLNSLSRTSKTEIYG